MSGETKRNYSEEIDKFKDAIEELRNEHRQDRQKYVQEHNNDFKTKREVYEKWMEPHDKIVELKIKKHELVLDHQQKMQQIDAAIALLEDECTPHNHELRKLEKAMEERTAEYDKKCEKYDHKIESLRSARDELKFERDEERQKRQCRD